MAGQINQPFIGEHGTHPETRADALAMFALIILHNLQVTGRFFRRNAVERKYKPVAPVVAQLRLCQNPRHRLLRGAGGALGLGSQIRVAIFILELL